MTRHRVGLVPRASASASADASDRRRDLAWDIARARRVASEERRPSFVMDARFGRVRDADVERRRDAHHHHHNRLLRHRASTSTRRRARDGREWSARTRWLARFVAACACVWLVSGSGSRRGGARRRRRRRRSASRRELASGRPRATTTVGGMRRESERAAVETATRAEAELEALKREHEAKERARVAATERTARAPRGVAMRRRRSGRAGRCLWMILAREVWCSHRTSSPRTMT